MTKHLSKKSKEVWREYTDKIVKSSARKAMLLMGLESLDRAEAARQIIEKEGMITTTSRSGVQHTHPAVKIENDSRSMALKIFKTLNIHLDPIWTGKIFD